MKVLLINPPFTGMGGVEGHGGSAAPLGLGYIASYSLKFHPEYEFHFFDAEGLRKSFDEIKAEVSRIRPNVVAVNMTTPSYGHTVKVTDVTKEAGSNIITVVGGPHPSAFPEEVIRESSIDACISGEGELTFLKFLEVIDKGGSLDDIPGLSHSLNGNPHVSSCQSTLIEDLDTIPFPARHLMPTEIYGPPPTKRLSGGRGGNMVTSRGCPYDCTYCESKVIWTRKTRHRSAENIVDEMEECYNNYGIREINFHDDILPMKRENTLELCREIRRRKLDMKWFCMNRVNFCWPDVMEEMYKAGCRKVMFGFESGNNEILKIIKKKATVEQAREAVKICRKAKLSVMGSFMIGNVGENEETIRETIEFAKSLDLDTGAFFIAIPYPGTELYAQAKKEGYIPEDSNWRDYTLVGTSPPPLNLPGITAERLREIQSQALREFYLRPKMIFKQLRKFTNIQFIKGAWVGAKLLMTLSLKQEKQGAIQKKAPSLS